ncbi:hypothetical protein KUTeg_017021 [Tegillarca granosa]|uniref:Transmembrane protein n=1 Tax=Tegillarca granosa TaxID=220873 RepID=A0ABQ9ERD8_TEGGR|nr:hypothetical protein KUTeg_017021 [Tegillarca granosa]
MVSGTFMKLIFLLLIFLISLASSTNEDVLLESENLMVHREKRDIIKITLKTTRPTKPTQTCKGFSCVYSFHAKGGGIPLRSGASTILFLSLSVLALLMWL